MPKIFGFEHITYLVVYIVLFAVSFFFLFRKKKVTVLKEQDGPTAVFTKEETSERTYHIVRKSLALVLLLCVVWNRIAIVFYNYEAGYDKSYNWFRLIPESFCGVADFLFALSVLTLKRDHPVFHFLAFLVIYGGLINTAYPTYIGQMPSFFYPATISGMLHHSVAMYLGVLLIATKYVTPSIKKYHYFFFGMAVFITWGTFLLTIFPDFEHYDPMYLTGPLIPNTILTWYFVGLLIFIVHAITLTIFELCNKKK